MLFIRLQSLELKLTPMCSPHFFKTSCRTNRTNRNLQKPAMKLSVITVARLQNAQGLNDPYYQLLPLLLTTTLQLLLNALQVLLSQVGSLHVSRKLWLLNSKLPTQLIQHLLLTCPGWEAWSHFPWHFSWHYLALWGSSLHSVSPWQGYRSSPPSPRSTPSFCLTSSPGREMALWTSHSWEPYFCRWSWGTQGPIGYYHLTHWWSRGIPAHQREGPCWCQHRFPT